ncbi:hypothetical protein ACWD4B_31475, partial [Streptomyces sp. NPDC002536]
MHRMPAAAALVAVAMSAAVGCVSVSPHSPAPGGRPGARPGMVQGSTREGLTVTGPGASSAPAPQPSSPAADGAQGKAQGPVGDPRDPRDPHDPKEPAEPREPAEPGEPGAASRPADSSPAHPPNASGPDRTTGAQLPCGHRGFRAARRRARQPGP